MGNSGLGEFGVRVEKLIPWVGNKYRLTRHYPRPNVMIGVPFCPPHGTTRRRVRRVQGDL